MTSTPTIRCVGCGAPFPDVSGPTHPYMESCPGCWAAYGEVLAREYGDRGHWVSHRLTVDAYAVQHPGRPSRKSAQSVAGHLMSLCVLLERGMPAEGATKVLAAAVDCGVPYPWLTPPASRGDIIVADVRKAADAGEHAEVVLRWAKGAWSAWAPRHGQIHAWLRFLGA
jgi:hypothetical protein